MSAVIGNFTGLSTDYPVFQPDAVRNPSGYPTGMDLKGILKRIERRLKKVELTAHAAEQEAGAPEAIRNLRRAVKNQQKRSGINAQTLDKLAPVLRTTVMWLSSEVGPEEADDAAGASSVMAPMISLVQAGEIKRPEHVDKFEDAPRVSAPGLDPRGQWIALTVEGDSMDRISPPGSIIFVDLKDKKPVPNACYVIEDEEGGATYKRWRPKPDRWEPVSQNRDYEPIFVKPGRGPRIVGRVRKSVIDL